MPNENTPPIEGKDDLDIFREEVRQSGQETLQTEDGGFTSDIRTLDTTTEELDSFRDYDVDISTDVQGMRTQQAENQSTWEQAGRAIVGGTAKGVLTAVENLGYLADVPNYFAMESMDDAMGNGLVQLAKEGKEAIDDNFAIYTKDPSATWDFSDSGWVFQQVQGLVDSAVGFGLTGSGVGSILGKGAAVLGNATKMGLITENVIQALGTGIATNYVESRMMSLELYKNVYDNAVSKGKTLEEAETMAAEEAHDFVRQNKTGILTDAFTYGNIISGKSLISGGKGSSVLAKEALNKKLAAGGSQFVKESLAESYEEISAGFLQKENERDAALKLDGADVNGKEFESKDSSFLGRAARYAASPEGLLEGTLGIFGGPLQSGATRAFTKVKEARNPDTSEQDSADTMDKELQDMAGQSLSDLSEHGQLVTDLGTSIDNAEDEAVVKSKKASLESHEESMFNTLAGRYFESGRSKDMKNLLVQASTDESLTEEKRANAKQRLENLPALEAEYIELKNKHGRAANVQGLWTNLQRRKGLDSYMNKAKETKEDAFNRVSEILSTDGTNIDPSIKQQASVIADIDAIEKQLDTLTTSEETVDPSLIRMVKTDLKKKQEQLDGIEINSAESNSLQEGINNIQSALSAIQTELDIELTAQKEFSETDVFKSVQQGSELATSVEEAEAALLEATDDNRDSLQETVDTLQSTLASNLESYQSQAAVFNSKETEITARQKEQQELLKEKQEEKKKALAAVLDTAPFQGLVSSLQTHVDAKIAHGLLTRQFYDSVDAKKIKKRQKESASNLVGFINTLDNKMSEGEFSEFAGDIRKIASRTSLTDAQRSDIETKLQNRIIEHSTFQSIRAEEQAELEIKQQEYEANIEKRRVFKRGSLLKRLFSKPSPKALETEELNYFTSIYSPAKIAEGHTREQLIDRLVEGKKLLVDAKANSNQLALSISNSMTLDSHLNSLNKVAALESYIDAFQQSVYHRDVLDKKIVDDDLDIQQRIKDRKVSFESAHKLKLKKILKTFKATAEVVTDSIGTTFDLSSFNINSKGVVVIQAWDKDGTKSNKILKGDDASEMEFLYTLWEISVFETKAPEVTTLKDLNLKTDKSLKQLDARLAKREKVLKSVLFKKKAERAKRSKVIKADYKRNLKAYNEATADGITPTIDQQQAFSFFKMSKESQSKQVDDQLNIPDGYITKAVVKLAEQRKKIADTINTNKLRRKAKKNGEDFQEPANISEDGDATSEDNQGQDDDFKTPSGQSKEIAALDTEFNIIVKADPNTKRLVEDLDAMSDESNQASEVKGELGAVDALITDIKEQSRSEGHLEDVTKLLEDKEVIIEKAEDVIRSTINALPMTSDDKTVLVGPSPDVIADSSNKKDNGSVLYGTPVNQNVNRGFNTGVFEDASFYKWAQKTSKGKMNARFKLSSGQETNSKTGVSGTYMYATLVDESDQPIDENGNPLSKEVGNEDKIRAVVYVKVWPGQKYSDIMDYVNNNNVIISPLSVGKGAVTWDAPQDQKIGALTDVKPEDMFLRATQVTDNQSQLKGGIEIAKSGLKHADGSNHIIKATQRHITDKETDILLKMYEDILISRDVNPSTTSKLSTQTLDSLKEMGIEGLTFSEIQNLIVYSATRSIDSTSRFNFNVNNRSFEMKTGDQTWETITVGPGETLTDDQKKRITDHITSLRVNVNKNFLNKNAVTAFTWNGMKIEQGVSLNKLFLEDGGDHISHLGSDLVGYGNEGVKIIAPKPAIVLDLKPLQERMSGVISTPKQEVSNSDVNEVSLTPENKTEVEESPAKVDLTTLKTKDEVIIGDTRVRIHTINEQGMFTKNGSKIDIDRITQIKPRGQSIRSVVNVTRDNDHNIIAECK